MIRNAVFASVIAFGAIGAAQAQDAGPRLVGGGDNKQLVYRPAVPAGAMVAGRAAQPRG
jgi:hypothetical protein